MAAQLCFRSISVANYALRIAWLATGSMHFSVFDLEGAW
jgi:hypothetical protein